MSPRIPVCLLFSIVSGAAALIWTVTAGWGILLGIAAYSIAGSVALVASALAAALLEGEPEAPAGSGFAMATAHSG